MLLKEGGASQHLQHTFEDLELSFAKLKKILSAAARGKLVSSEKLDGMNVNLSFRDGKATYARNKSDLLNLGRDFQDLLKRKFPGGEKVRNAFISAFKSYEKAIKTLDPETLEKIFQGGTVFFNAEILGPAFTNVINYDKNIITIHQTGHKKVNHETQKIESLEDQRASKLLDKAIDQIEQHDSGVDFKLQRGAMVKLNQLSDKTDLKILRAKIDKIMASAGMSDSNTIGDFLKSKLMPIIQNRLQAVDPQIQELVMDNVLGIAKLNQLPKGTPQEIKSTITSIKKEAPDLLKKAILPLELAIHDFAVELLRGMKSAYVMDNRKELIRLRKELAKAIKTIQASGNQDAMKILTQQLAKIKHHDNINTAAEGFVFNYDGKNYKFTGNFAPVNQILNLFKYGRGKKIPAFQKKQELSEIEKDGRIIAVIPGSFKPPHAGHYAMAKYLAARPEIDLVMIIVSPKERGGHSATRRISVDKVASRKLWLLYTRNDPKIKVEIASSPSPIKATFDVMEKLNPGDTLVLAMGDKEVEAEDKRFANAQKYSDKLNLGVRVEVVAIPQQAEGLSGTEVRELIAGGNREEYLKTLPPHLSPKEREIAWKIVNVVPSNINEAVEHTESGMIAIMIPSKVQNEVEKLGLFPKNSDEAEEKKNLHCTLVFLGKTSEIDEKTKNKIKKAIKKVVKNHTPIKASLAGLGKFTVGEDGMPYYASVDAKGLNKLQYELEEAIKEIIELPSEHGFTPHMTLGYIGDENEIPEITSMEMPSWTIKDVSLVFGDSDREDFAFASIEERIARIVKEEFQDDVAKRHKKMKAKIVATGPQDAGVAYPEDAETERSKSAPPGFGAMGESTVDDDLPTQEEKFDEEFKDFVLDHFIGTTQVRDLMKSGERSTQELYHIYVAAKKFGIIDLKDWIYSLTNWLEGWMQSGEKFAKILLAHRNITEHFFGKPNLPKEIFRGLRIEGVEVVPLNQPIFYEPLPGQKSTSWSTEYSAAENFCDGSALEEYREEVPAVADGVVFQCYTDEVFETGEIFLWPPSVKEKTLWGPVLPELKVLGVDVQTLLNEKEVGLWQEAPSPIEPLGVHYCGIRDAPVSEEESGKPLFVRHARASETNVPPVIIREEPQMNEVSAISAGAVEGPAGGANDEERLIRENESFEEEFYKFANINAYNPITNAEKAKQNFPLLFSAMKKFGIKEVVNWGKLVIGWVRQSDDAIAKKLLHNRKITEYIFGPAPKPKWVFRGMIELRNIPKPGQPTIYTPQRKKASSWTAHFQIAKDFCAGSYRYPETSEIVVACSGKEVAKSATMFLWPSNNESIYKEMDFLMSIEPSTIVAEKEIGLWINKPIAVSGIHYCSIKKISKDDVGRITKLKRKGIKEEDVTSQPFFQKLPSPEQSQKEPIAIGEGDTDEMKRNDFVNELRLRETIRETIKIVQRQEKSNVLQTKIKENKLRQHIRSIIQEVAIGDKTPHHSTGINVLEELLKKIVPILEEGYKTLTTSEQQRESFRAHIVRAIQNTIAPHASRSEAGTEKMISVDEEDEAYDESKPTTVTIGDEPEDVGKPEDNDEFIDIDDKGPSKEEEERAKLDNFTLPGEDMTGRNVAISTFEKIEQNIIDSYDLLNDEEDRENFYTYLITNVKLYLDKYEQELSPELEEPTNPEYEEVEGEQVSDEIESGEESEKDFGVEEEF